MVGEFPELQGVMGRYYALHDSEDPRVADAIADHYKPLGPNDTCPTTPDSIVVSLADKLDSLAAFFAINDKPTGSGDPFALRRAALGVIRIIIENDLRLPLRDVFFRALTGLGVADDSKAAVVDDLLSFVMDRFSVYLRNMGYGVGMIRAVSSRGRVVQVGGNRSVTREDDVVRLARRIAIFQNFIGSEAGANLVVAYRRAANIVQIEEKRDGCSYDGAVLRAQLRQPEETELEARLRQVMQDETAALATEDFEGAMAALATLRRPVDEFFDKVTVNADDPALRENRLRLLSRIRAVMNQVADFSQIEG
jgi:glycyl-tRNA synthetase beta chain